MSNKVILVVIDGLGLQTSIEQCGYLESLVAGGKARRWTMEAVLPSLSVPIYETLQKKGNHHAGQHRDEHPAERCQHQQHRGTEHNEVDRFGVGDILVHPRTNHLQKLHGFFCSR